MVRVYFDDVIPTKPPAYVSRPGGGEARKTGKEQGNKSKKRRRKGEKGKKRAEEQERKQKVFL